MSVQDFYQNFSSENYLPGQILVVPPTEFYRLDGLTAEGSRMLIMVVKGTMHLTQNGKMLEVNSHSFVDISGTSSVTFSQFSHNLHAWCLSVTFEFASSSLKNLRPGPMPDLADLQNAHILKFSDDESFLICHQFTLLSQTLNNLNNVYRIELMESYFRCFCLELGNIQFNHVKQTEKPTVSCITRRDFITHNFIELACKHYATEHQIEFYANALCVSPKHLTRVIKEMTGKTPKAFISDEIVIHAMTMLEDESIPVGQIAEELNFSDQAAFCKFFKGQKNISPMEYRRRLNRENNGHD